MEDFQISFKELQKYFEPGIFSVKCKVNEKIFYEKSENVAFGVGFFIDNLNLGQCPNVSLLNDFKQYGYSQFEFKIVKVSEEFADPALLERELEDIQSNCTGPRY